ncbi:von Willebrand factor A domain-containing protein 7-like isoform X1 [Oncorhynchus kisutch]|nr:von Willebrand factor A domain-containing protein 7-like isoform X1 [Oncorhynchus kisutch]
MGIFSAAKPKGKCSHGGAADLTSSEVPRGGISKDERRSDNVALHTAAVTVATTATLRLLDDIRGAAGDNDYLRFMGIARSSVVAFVIDTTGSMRDDILEAKSVVNEIIDSRKGTQDEPSQYILVPFNDPEFGPLIRTTNPDVMKTEIAKLKADGGGDLPEMCLSGLQLALTGAPASSHIFVFTDAIAKDIALGDTILALIRSTKSTVSFFMTGAGAGARRRRSGVESREATFETYKDLALASGGQAIGVTKENLPQATDVIIDSSTSALVTVLQRARNPGKAETFSFLLDESLNNITIYITGKSLTFTLKNPAGVTQKQNEVNGELGTVQTVGNLFRVRLASNKQTGLWEISMNSNQPYTLKVTGQSTIAFIYDFVETFEGPHPGYALISGRPKAGMPAMLLVSVLGRKGPASVKVANVALVTVSGLEVVGGTLEDMGNGDFLVTVTKVPAGEFVVLLNGTDVVSSTVFQRQSTTQMSVSKVTIKAVVDRSMEPGKTFTLPFTVMTDATGGSYKISARNDRDFKMNVPGSIAVTTGGNATGELTITVPANTPSGTDVTLTIEAVAPGASDSNYAVLRLSVVTKVTDFTPPQCEVVSVSSVDCPADPAFCNSAFWQLSANLTDGVNGTGITSLTHRQGVGSLTHTDLKQTVVAAAFNASCCSLTVELVAVDKAMNVGTCLYTTKVTDVTPPQCEVVSVSSVDCPADPAFCNSAFWQLSANLTDGVNGTGITSLTHRQGAGSLTHTDLKQTVVAAAFNASCCSLTVELVAVDKAMNVGTCLYTTKVTDVTPPQCEVVSVSVVDCPADPAACSSAFWQLSANLTDGVNGTGIASLTHLQGIGSLTHTDLKQMVVAAAFNASCCSLTVELEAVDKAMNVGTCRFSIVRNAGPPSIALSLPLLVCLLVSAFFTTSLRDLLI